MSKLKGFLLMGLAVFIYAAAAASFLSLFMALQIPDTVVAIESAFGSFVITIGLLVLGKKVFGSAKARLKPHIKTSGE